MGRATVSPTSTWERLREGSLDQADAAAGLAVDDPEVPDELDEVEDEELEVDEPSDPDDVPAARAAVTGALRVPVLGLPFDAARASVR